MAGTAYHNEALRKSRVMERKQEAMRKLTDIIAHGKISSAADNDKHCEERANLVFSEPGHYAQNRSKDAVSAGTADDGVVFEEVVHDSNFKYRMMRDSGTPPLHVDPIYKIMYPGQCMKQK